MTTRKASFFDNISTKNLAFSNICVNTHIYVLNIDIHIVTRACEILFSFLINRGALLLSALFLWVKTACRYNFRQGEMACAAARARRELPKVLCTAAWARRESRKYFAPLHGLVGNSRKYFALLHGLVGNSRNHFALLQAPFGKFQNHFASLQASFNIRKLCFAYQYN